MKEDNMQPTAADEKSEDVSMHDAGEASVQTKAETESADVPMRPPPDEPETGVSPAPAAEPAVSAAAETAVHAAPAAEIEANVVAAAAPAAETAVPAPPTAGTAAAPTAGTAAATKAGTTTVRRRRKFVKRCTHHNCSEAATAGCRWKRCRAHCTIMLQNSDKQCKVHT